MGTVPFAPAFNSSLFETLHRLRKNPVAAYGIAVAIVALATAARWAIGGKVMEGLPFLTYYPAVIITALAGGFGAGTFAAALSAVVAWYVFLPSRGGWEVAVPAR